jgi:hypothetical protein
VPLRVPAHATPVQPSSCRTCPDPVSQAESTTSCVPRKSSCAASAAVRMPSSLSPERRTLAAARASPERSSGFSPTVRVGASALKLTCRMGGDRRGDRVRRVRESLSARRGRPISGAQAGHRRPQSLNSANRTNRGVGNAQNRHSTPQIRRLSKMALLRTTSDLGDTSQAPNKDP